jgi:DNA invertase Pin-like site-specific DNA recombinase
MKIAIYARVSTRQHGQDVNTQLLALREWARLRGVDIVEEYIDRVWSWGKNKKPGPEYERLMRDARKKHFDAVLVAAFDRFARTMRHLLAAADELETLSIDFISLRENIDTTTPTGKLVFHILASIAEFERSIIKERVLLGVDRARKQGKTLGRPPKNTTAFYGPDIARQLAEGATVSSIARQYGLARSTVREIAKRQTAPVREGTPRGPDEEAGCAQRRV